MHAAYFDVGTWTLPHTDKLAGYTLSDYSSLGELVDFHSAVADKHPGHHGLLVIDDPPHAFDGAAQVLSEFGGDDKAPVEYFQHLRSALEVGLPAASIDDILGNKFLGITEAEVELAEVNTDPSLMMGGDAYCLLAPTDKPLEAFLAAPQAGWGLGHLAVYLYIEHITQCCDLTFAGLDGTYLYFAADSVIEQDQANTIAATAGRFHDDFDEAAHTTLTTSIAGNQSVILTFRNW